MTDVRHAGDRHNYKEQVDTTRLTPWGVAIAILVILGSVAFLVLTARVVSYTDDLKVHPPDYCPTGTPPQLKEGFTIPGHTAIIIDTSNEIPEEDMVLAFQKLVTWTRESAPFLQRLTIFGLPESGNNQNIQKYGPWCIPKEGEDADPIYENRVFVEAQFRKFLDTLNIVFHDLVGRTEADQSPIIETMADLVRSSDSLDSIVLVSDMLQHTPLWSHYTMEGDTLSIRSVCDGAAGAGQLKTIYVYYINRGLTEIQALDWPDAWWQRCLGDVSTEMLN